MRKASMLLSRRSVLAGGAAVASAAAGAALVSVVAGAKDAGQITLEPRVTEFDFGAGQPTRNVLSYAERRAAPILRVRQGDRLAVRLRNGLPEPTTIHWHGIRLPNAMDGVPFLTQSFVYENETFDYSFVLPDAGSYWYHPHCNSLQQLSYGLTGLLIVDEAKDPGFDADLALNVRDWRLDEAGQFIKLYNPRQTARAGTHGTVRTANWHRAPELEAPAGSLTRLRVVITDVTRIYKLGLDGAAGLIVALDGNPLPEPVLIGNHHIGPGQRMDLVVRMPESEGQTVTLQDFSSPEATIVARLKAKGASLRRDLRAVRPLEPNPIAEPDLKAAETLSFEFTATADQIAKSRICGDLGYSFWAINQKVWPGSSPDPFAPMAELKLGRSYILSFFNRTPHAHPIHLHGLCFKLLRSDKRPLPPVWTDTALVMPEERIDVGLVADNIGDWLLHCHVIEHQETGMTGFIRVT